MELPRDKKGRTEAEFLRDYDVTEYFRPSVTVDAVLYSRTARGLKMLLIGRGGHPYIGNYAFPGGFVNEFESCECAVLRELDEETGVTDVKLEQLVTVSTPGRDPRWRNITVVYCGEVAGEPTAVAGDDAAAAQWFDVSYSRKAQSLDLECAASGEKFRCVLNVVRDAFGRIDLNETTVTERGMLAFDHAKIIAYLFESKKGEWD